MIFGSLGLLVAAGGLLAAGIINSNTGLLVGSLACTILAGILLLVAYAAAKNSGLFGAAQATALPVATVPGAVPGAVPGTQSVLMYVPVSQLQGALQPVGAPTAGNGSSVPSVEGNGFAPTPPFLGYDDMTADQVGKLIASGALTVEQLVAVREYEERGQARKTVLDKLGRAIR